MTWSVILAGGEGVRLGSLTTALYGEPLPKQFAVLRGRRSLLQETVERVAPLSALERVVVVVARERAALAREQLAAYAGVRVLPQPAGRGTGPGILYPLAWIRARDPEAAVAVFPGDHDVRDAATLRAVVARLLASARGGFERVTLVGATPTSPETEYGWIVPGAAVPDREVRDVRQFVEKPNAVRARALFEDGALWNTFISTGALESFWELARRWLPSQTCAFESLLPALASGDTSALDAAYASMSPADFSRSILEKAERLAVARLEGSGWCDWGTPERVIESLRETGEHIALFRRIGAQRRIAA